MAKRVAVLVLVAVLSIASVAFLMFSAPPPRPESSVPPAGTARTAAATPTITYNYSDFFNVPYGEWWDMRAPLYGDEPVNASCFNKTSVADGTCTTSVPGLNPYSQYPYMDWAGSGNAQNEGSATSVFAPYRTHINGLSVPGYNLSQPVFLPVTNYAAPPGNTLSFNWYLQYLDKANFTLVTSTRGCYGGTGATANDGYQLWNQIHITLDNQEAARLFGATVSANAATIQSWWNTNTLPGCGHSKTQFGPLESSLDTWFSSTANGKYDIFNGYDAAYTSLYTNVTAVVHSGGASGLTDVYIEHGAWGSEILLDRWFYWGNATYAGSQANSSRAAGWWGMENGWWEDVHYSGSLGSSAMNFNLTGVLQYHFQEKSLPGPDGVFRSSTNPSDSDDTPYWTWGPELVDYNFASSKGPYSEMNAFSSLNYIKSTPGSGNYGTNTSFDYTPNSWAAKANEWWTFVFPTNTSGYFQNPATSPLGTDPFVTGTPLPTISSGLALQQIFPAGYGTWTAGSGTWAVVGPSSVSWPPSTPTGGYPYIPYPGIYLGPSSVPPEVTTGAASAITATSATLNGNLVAIGSAASATVGFLYGTSPTLAGATNYTVGTHAVGAFSYGLTSLTAGTNYYYAAWANGAGFSQGTIQTFTAGVYPPTVTTAPASAINGTGGTLNGNLADLGSASTVTVGFLWGTSSTLVGAANVTVGPVTAAGAFTKVLTGLATGTTYYFQAWASGSRFVSGAILNFAPVASPTVTTSAATAVSSTSATLNGNAAALGSASYVTVGFLWGTDSGLAGATNVTVGPISQVGTFNATVTGLTAGTTYYFAAWASGAGFSEGTIQSFTAAAVAGAPSVSTSAASAVTTSGATLNGNVAGLGSASTVTVGFLWGTDSGLAGATNVTVGPQTATGAFSAPVTGLAAGTTYYFEAWTNGNGFAHGAIQSFTTQSSTAPPSEPTFLGMPALVGYSVVAVILLVIVAVVVVFLMRRHKKSPPETPPASPPPSP